MTDVVFVIIGRNEGEHLQRCFSSVLLASQEALRCGLICRAVYVDSQSTDNSVELARQNGVPVLYSHPDYGTPSNARNTGVILTKSTYLMFIDGDMELSSEWVVNGVNFLLNNQKAAGVSGLRNDMRLSNHKIILIENYYKTQKEVSIVNSDVGGAYLYRRSALEAVGGFEPELPCNEEAVLCCELRSIGWELYRIKVPMIVHWDTKVASPLQAIRHILLSRKSTVSGVIFRYAVLSSKWWRVYLLGFQKDLLWHTLWGIGMCAVIAMADMHVGIFLFLVGTSSYVVGLYNEKGDLNRAVGALLLRTVYVVNFVVGLLLNRPRLVFGVQNNPDYVNKIQQINTRFSWS